MKLGDPAIIGEMMRKRRHEMGFTMEQMAAAVGLSPITIMRIELGRVGYIHAKTAKALEVPKKIERRLVMTPTAITQDGQAVPLPPLSAMTRPPLAPKVLPQTGTAPTVIGDSLPAYYDKLKKARAAKLEKKQNKSLTKRMLLWLADKA